MLRIFRTQQDGEDTEFQRQRLAAERELLQTKAMNLRIKQELELGEEARRIELFRFHLRGDLNSYIPGEYKSRISAFLKSGTLAEVDKPVNFLDMVATEAGINVFSTHFDIEFQTVRQVADYIRQTGQNKVIFDPIVDMNEDKFDGFITGFSPRSEKFTFSFSDGKEDAFASIYELWPEEKGAIDRIKTSLGRFKWT